MLREVASGSSVLTIEQAAADLATTPDRIWRFHREGRLAIIYLAGSAKARRTGSKDGRIDREEWRRFKRDLTVSVTPEAVPAASQGPGRPAKGAEPEPGGFLDRFEKKAKSAR